MKLLWLTTIGRPSSLLILGLTLLPAIAQRAAATNSGSQARPLSLIAAQPAQPAKPSPPAQPLCPAQLGTAIDAIANRPQFQRARWGILIQTVAASPTSTASVYARDAQHYFIPASNAKILTTAATLHKLGSQFRIRTSVYRVDPRSQLTGSQSTILRVVGRGDPSLNNLQLRSLAQQLARQGMQRIDQLLGDDFYFRGLATHPTWEWEDVQAGYGAPVNSLIVNQNAVGFRLIPQALDQPLKVQWDNPAEAGQWQVENQSRSVGTTETEFLQVGRDLGKPILRVEGQLRVGAEPESAAIAVLNPAENFLRYFQQALLAQKISVTRISLAPSPTTMQQLELAAVTSPPLSTLLVETNQESNNLYAEALLRSLGATQTPASTESAAETGLAALKATLTELGVNPQSYILVDGSGLSRHSLVSPEALVQTLQAIARSPEAAVYRASLPVAGVSGTLQNRFRDTPAQGILQAKTGTLSGVGALSGYLNAPNYQPLVFSIIVNQSDQPASVLRQAIDEIALLLTRLRRC
jgi:D-alanyl-D-alanine carboxypeptidase/D-alanyl-D-alanine-endopeptidase (penicillin-binding protein 4)